MAQLFNVHAEHQRKPCFRGENELFLVYLSENSNGFKYDSCTPTEFSLKFQRFWVKMESFKSVPTTASIRPANFWMNAGLSCKRKCICIFGATVLFYSLFLLIWLIVLFFLQTFSAPFFRSTFCLILWR